MTGPVRISAVIPTHNRGPYLRKALSALVAQTLPADQYEIIVVDNRSTDDTKRIVVEEFGGASNLRYVYEPELGLNIARNTGWQNASGGYIAYLDDDAIPDSDWLHKIIETFESVDPKPGCVGGRVDPIWEGVCPGWLPPELTCMLTILDIDSASFFGPANMLVGANMAFDRLALKKVGGFVVGLDRIGSKLISGGETLIQRQMDSLGVARYYNPAIRVGHHIPAFRLTQKWFLQRGYWQGWSDAFIEVRCHSLSRLQRLRTGAYRARQFLFSSKIQFLWSKADSPDSFRLKWDAVSRCGGLMGMLGLGK